MFRLQRSPLPRNRYARRRLLIALSAAPLALNVRARDLDGKARSFAASANGPALPRMLKREEIDVLAYASFAPSGHNAQPWRVRVLEPGHWQIGTEKARWLPAVDPTNRETALSLGAFLENLIIAAQYLGYAIDYRVIASAATDPDLIDLRLRSGRAKNYPIARLQARRTVRTGYANDPLKREDLQAVTGRSSDFIYFPGKAKQARYLAQATIDATRKQAYREAAQRELADWIRWSKRDQERHRNGLTPSSMEITGPAGWYVSTFYSRESVMKKGFRETSINQAAQRVRQGSGWLVLTGGSSIASLIETGRQLQRMWLKLRDRGIAIHPMTQLLEETPHMPDVAKELGVAETPQFLLRIGYVKRYPDPVSLRMPVAWFTFAASPGTE